VQRAGAVAADIPLMLEARVEWALFKRKYL
jgi:hypothetical protein